MSMAERNITLQFRAVAPADPTYQKLYGKFPIIVVPVSEAKQTISTFHKKGFQLLSSSTSPAQAERTIYGKKSRIPTERKEDVALSTPFFEFSRDTREPTQAEKRLGASLTEDVRYLSPSQAKIRLKEKEILARETREAEELELNKVSIIKKPTKDSTDPLAPSKALSKSDFFTTDLERREEIKEKFREKARIGTQTLVTGISFVEASTVGRATQFVTRFVPTQFGKGLVDIGGGLIGFFPFTLPKLLLSPKQQLLEIGAGAVESYKGSKARFAGQVAGALIFPATFKKLAPKAIGEARTITRTKVPVEQLVPEEVLSGAKRFPEAPRSQQAKLFVEGGARIPDEPSKIKTGAGFHATGSPIKDSVVTAGSSYAKGLFISPYLSPNFLRIFQSNKLFSAETGKGSIFGKPTAYRVYPKGVKEVPSSVAGSAQRARTYLSTKGKEGIAYVTKVKTEAEAVIKEPTAITKEPTPYYTKVGGVKLPIDVIRTGQPKPTTFIGRARQRTFIKSLSYEAPTTFAVTTPTSLLVSSVSASRYSSPKYSIPSVVSSPISSGVKSSSPLVSGSSFVGSPSSFVGTPSRSSILKPPRSSPSLLFSKTTTAPPYPTSSPPSTPLSTTFGSSFPIKKQKKRKLDKKVKKSVITTPFDPKYTFSIEARELGIKGKPSKSAVKTGLGLRPLRR